MNECYLSQLIRDVPDFPKPGILFKDITPLLAHVEGFADTIDRLAECIDPYRPNGLLAIESRGFIFGAALSVKTGLPLRLVRKSGKLPGDVVGQSYDLEYGQDRVEAHPEIFTADASFAVIDDLLATGGTARATVDLVQAHQSNIACCAFVIELSALQGRARLSDCPVESLIQYE
jgi:adenine phosphoribosyltransferase